MKLLFASAGFLLVFSFGAAEGQPAKQDLNFQHENSAFGTQNNLFRRVITACPASDYAQSDATSLTPSGLLVGTASTKVYNITVTVKWPEGLSDKHITIRSIMSDWKQR